MEEYKYSQNRDLGRIYFQEKSRKYQIAKIGNCETRATHMQS